MKKNVKKMSKFVFFSIVFITIFFIDSFYFNKLVPNTWITLIRDAEYKFYDFQVRKLSSEIKERRRVLETKVDQKEFAVGSETFQATFDELAIDMKASKEIVVVAIDEKSLTQFGAWPFKRSYYSDFLKNLFEKGNARGVVFDIVFSEKGETATVDALKEIREMVKDSLGDKIDLTIEKLNYNQKMEESFLKYRLKIVAGYTTLSDAESKEKDYSQVYFPLDTKPFVSNNEAADQAVFKNFVNVNGGIFNYDTMRNSLKYRGYFSVKPDSDGSVRMHDPLRVYPAKFYDRIQDVKTDSKKVVFPSLSLSAYTMLRGGLQSPRIEGDYISLEGLERYLPNKTVRNELKNRVVSAVNEVKSISDHQRQLLLKILDKYDIMTFEKVSDLSRFLALYASGDLDKMEGEYSGFLAGVSGIRNKNLKTAILRAVDSTRLKQFLDPTRTQKLSTFAKDFEVSHKNLGQTLVQLLKEECLSQLKQELIPLFAFKGEKKTKIIEALKNVLKIDEAFIKNNFSETNLVKTNNSIQLNQNGKLYIQFKGSINSYMRYSMIDVVNGEDLHGSLMSFKTPKTSMLQAFEDKIVLLGPTAIGINDWRSTPVHQQLDGVELHAQIIDNMLDKSYVLRTIPMKLVEIVLMLILVILLSIIIRRVNGSYGALIMVMFLTAYLSFASYMFDTNHLYFQFLPIPLLSLSLYLFLATYQYIQEEKDKKKTRMAFSNYVNKSVVDAVLQDPDMLKLGGQKRVMTVLFSDVRSFTTISEKLDPETLVAFMNEYLEEMTELVLQYDGTLDKFIGDAVMAFWGAPINQENHAELSVRCAIDMNNKLDIMRQKLMDKYDVDCRIGVGCNTGPMVVGNMGSKNRFNYTILGDAVNLGARLEGQTKNYGAELILGASTYELTKHFCATRFLDLIAVKGKSEPVSIYECYGYKDDQTPEFLAGMKAYEDAITTYYLGRRFEEGIQVFEDLKSHRGGTDIACDLYIDRCRDFLENPPDENWNGVFVATSK